MNSRFVSAMIEMDLFSSGTCFTSTLYGKIRSAKEKQVHLRSSSIDSYEGFIFTCHEPILVPPLTILLCLGPRAWCFEMGFMCSGP